MELVTQHAERGGCVAEPARDFCRGQSFQEVGPQGLVLPLARGCRFLEEAAAFYKVDLSADSHDVMMLIFAAHVYELFAFSATRPKKSTFLSILSMAARHDSRQDTHGTDEETKDNPYQRTLYRQTKDGEC